MKKRVRWNTLSRFAAPILIGSVVYAGACLLAAWMILQGYLPEEGKTAAALVSAMLASLACGAASRGGGRRGLICGAGLMLLYLMLHLAVGTQAGISEMTAIGAGICLTIPWLSSCIFHKKTNSYTKRNRKTVPRR